MFWSEQDSKSERIIAQRPRRSRISDWRYSICNESAEKTSNTEWEKSELRTAPRASHQHKETRNCFWNGRTVCEGPCWSISHHSVEHGVVFGSDCD